MGLRMKKFNVFGVHNFQKWQSVIQNFRAASRIFKKSHFWLSFSRKYCKIALFLERRAFQQILRGAACDYRTLISFGLFLEWGHEKPIQRGRLGQFADLREWGLARNGRRLRVDTPMHTMFQFFVFTILSGAHKKYCMECRRHKNFRRPEERKTYRW